MEIKAYHPRSRVAYVLHVVFLVCLVAQREYSEAFWIGIASIVLAFVLTVIAFRKSKLDANYRRVFRLKILDDALTRGLVGRFKYANITDVSFKDDKLKIVTKGRTYTYNLVEHQLEKIVELKNRIAKYKKAQDAIRYRFGYKVTYSGTEMTVDLLTQNKVNLDNLLGTIGRIQNMVVIDKINLSSPEGNTQVLSGQDIENIDQVMHGRLEC